MLSQAFCFTIYDGIISLVHVREVVDGLNDIDKLFLFQLISNVQLPGEKGYVTQMVMNTGTRTYDASLAIEFQKHLSTEARKHGVDDHG